MLFGNQSRSFQPLSEKPQESSSSRNSWKSSRTSGEREASLLQGFVGHTPIERSKPREPVLVGPVKNRKWLEFDKEDVRSTLSMYGKNFLFLDRV